MRQFSGEALGLMQDLLAEVSEGGTDSPPKQFNSDLLNTTVTPLLCEIIVRHPATVGVGCADRLLEKFPACMNLTNQALGCLLVSQVQSGKFFLEHSLFRWVLR